MALKFQVILALFVALFLVSCSGSKGVEWNQKLTVVVEVDGKEYAGSGVSKMRAYGAGVVAHQSRGASIKEKIQGETVVVDLGPHGYLFALWNYQDPGGYARSLKRRPKRQDDYEKVVAQSKKYYGNLKGKRLLNPGTIPTDEGEYPLLVAFKDIQNPKSIQVFAEKYFYEKRKRNATTYSPKSFARYYGGNARVKSITFEITKDPVTDGRLSAVLSDEYFEMWQQLILNYRHPADCIDRTKNRYFCTLHKGMWIRRFPGENK